METKHTPGKWFANGSDTSLATWVEDANGKRVCTMRQCEDDWERAQLIAQAPDLLAERDRLAAINAELVAALDELRRRLWAHITLDVKKHYSLMLADSAASEVTFRAKAKQTAA